MPRPLILAIDQGTTGTTALIVDDQLAILGKSRVEFQQIFPHPGWVEHEDEAIWLSVKEAVGASLRDARVAPEAISAIGITNQRETTCLFDDQGKAAHNFIVWQCRRTAEICDVLKKRGKDAGINSKTGLLLDPYFSATKLMWLFSKYPVLLEGARAGKIHFGTIDSWLIYRLTAGASHVTDATNASRTLLMDLKSLSWDEELLRLFGIPHTCLPEIRPSCGIVGRTKNLAFLPDGIPIAGVAGDQQAALFGEMCFQPGEAKATYGTGSFVLMNTGTKPHFSQSGLLSSVAIQMENEVQYCLEGSAFVAGAAVQWLRDGLGIIQASAEVEALARQVEETGDVVFVPALTGLGAPYWRPHARGVIKGLSRDTTKAHLARASLEGIAFQNYDILNAMRQTGVELRALKVDGGATRNDLLLQFQSDILCLPCIRPKAVEATGLGAAMLAGLGVGIWRDKNDLVSLLSVDRVFTPQMDDATRKRHLLKWAEAVSCA